MKPAEWNATLQRVSSASGFAPEIARGQLDVVPEQGFRQTKNSALAGNSGTTALR